MDVTNNERSYMFPDGGNEALPGDVQDIIWATKEFKQMIEIHRQTIDEVIKQGCTMSPIINPGIDTSNTNKREMEE